jgi:hypothetical protein
MFLFMCTSVRKNFQVFTSCRLFIPSTRDFVLLVDLFFGIVLLPEHIHRFLIDFIEKFTQYAVGVTICNDNTLTLVNPNLE